MRTALSVVLLSLCASAQSASPYPNDLFRQAHDFFARVPAPDDRAYGLAELLMHAPNMPANELSSWAGEAYQASLTLKPSSRKSFIQQLSIQTIAHTDADAALALLLQQGPLSPDSLAIFNPGISLGDPARVVFRAMLARHGGDAIPQLTQAVETVASKGAYPYLALSALMAQAAPEQKAKLFQAALAAYTQSNPTIGNDFQFAMFLKSVAFQVPKQVARPAAMQIVERMEQFAAAGVPCDSTLRLYSDNGMTVLNCSDRIMYEALPALERLNPEAAAKLKTSHPVLQQATSSPDRLTMPMKNAPATPEAEKSQMLFDTSIMLEKIATQEPVKAAEIAGELPDEFERLNTTVLVARELAAADPERAKVMLNGILNQVGAIDNSSSNKRITLSSNIASVAAKLGDRALLQESIQRAFAAARENIANNKKASTERRILLASNCYGLRLVPSFAATAAPQLLLEVIPTLGDDEAEAYLLMYFAEATLHADH